MILGLNTNHEYNGKVYHVQTEDSGLENPWIITHCFIGGTIIKTRRIEYRDALGRDDLESHLTEIAREQHRGMIKSLLSGAFAKEILKAGRGGGGGRAEIPMADKGKGRRFKPTGGANKLPGKGKGPPSRGPTKAVGGRRPPPLPPKGKAGDARRTQAFGDTQVMDIDESDLVEVAEDAELRADGPLQFPSALLRARPLDPVTLAYLLEDDPVR